MQKHPLISINLSIGPYPDFIREILDLTGQPQCSEYVCIANAHMLVETYRQADFKEVVENAVITTPDGVSLTWGLKWLHGIRQDRVAGMDLLPDLLEAASEQRKAVFFYGGTNDLLNKTKQHIRVYYPGIPQVGVYSPPFRPLTENEETEIVDLINKNNPHLVFVVLGCPKQEKWMASMRGRVKAVMIGVGAALPVLVGEQKRAPLWMQQSGLEWCYRLRQEPRRLFKRYFITNTAFILLLLQAKIKKD
ncbi:glycosyl transferase [Bacteroidia bacterium]|nr:glycosyl transferase [Bacteroidia bacterium]